MSKATPDNPVYLAGLHGFAAWANKKALQAAGITKETPDPENGKIVRDEKTGEPTGILLNRAQALVEKHLPPMTLEQTKKAIELAAQVCIRNGLTSLHEARVSGLMVQAFRELIREGHLPLRIYVMLDGADQSLVQEWLARGPEIDPRHQFTFTRGSRRCKSPRRAAVSSANIAWRTTFAAPFNVFFLGKPIQHAVLLAIVECYCAP